MRDDIAAANITQAKAKSMDQLVKWLLTITEVGMLAYWVLAILVVVEVIVVSPEVMYSDYQNPLIVSWNWSFLPLDVLFAMLGLMSRFAPLSSRKRDMLATASVSLMFCAGLMAISFWLLQGSFDPFWWGVNVWLMVLSMTVFVRQLLA